MQITDIFCTLLTAFRKKIQKKFFSDLLFSNISTVLNDSSREQRLEKARTIQFCEIKYISQKRKTCKQEQNLFARFLIIYLAVLYRFVSAYVADFQAKRFFLGFNGAIPECFFFSPLRIDKW